MSCFRRYKYLSPNSIRQIGILADRGPTHFVEVQNGRIGGVGAVDALSEIGTPILRLHVMNASR
jgi:hypothetical protein